MSTKYPDSQNSTYPPQYVEQTSVPMAIPVTAEAEPVLSQGELSEKEMVEARQKQLLALWQHSHNQLPYEGLLPFFPMPQQIDDEFYVRVMGHGIHPRYWPMLNIMRTFDFAFVIDNSGSMGWDLNNSDLPYGERRRCDELHFNSSIMLDIICALDDDGIDVYTINPVSCSGQTRSTYEEFKGSRFSGISSQSQLDSIFACKPRGRTPMTKAVTAAIYDHAANNSDPNRPYKPLMLIIATDGVPDNQQAFVDLVLNRDTDRVAVTFLICTDRDHEVEYLDDLDKTPSVEAIDDYHSEKAQILEHQMPGFTYSRGDHEARKICGAAFPILDKIDEQPLPDFDRVGEEYLPPEMGDIVVDICENNLVVQRKMREYAQDHPELARYMLDVAPDTPQSHVYPPVRAPAPAYVPPPAPAPAPMYVAPAPAPSLPVEAHQTVQQTTHTTTHTTTTTHMSKTKKGKKSKEECTIM